MRVRWLKRAIRNVEDIYDDIAEDNPSAAESTRRSIREAVEHLSDHPAMGRPGRALGIRELLVPRTPYIVPYRVQGDEVIVIRVLHGARRWPGRL